VVLSLVVVHMEDGIKYSKTSNYGMKIQKKFRGRHGGYSSLRVIFLYSFSKIFEVLLETTSKNCAIFLNGAGI